MQPKDLSLEAVSAFRVWTKVFGLSEASALNALREDGLVEESEGDRLAGSFANVFGLSEAAARVAAEGRRQASEVRRSEDDASEIRLRLAEEALAAMSDSECDAFLEEQRRKFRAKTTPKSGGAAKKSATVVSERGGLRK